MSSNATQVLTRYVHTQVPPRVDYELTDFGHSLEPVLLSMRDWEPGVMPAERGMAVGINDTFRQVGLAAGVAALGVVFLSRRAARISHPAAGTPAAAGGRPVQFIQAVATGNLRQLLAAVPAASRPAIAGIAARGFLSGLNTILTAAAVTAYLGAALSAALIRRQSRLLPAAAIPEPLPQRSAALAITQALPPRHLPPAREPDRDTL